MPVLVLKQFGELGIEYKENYPCDFTVAIDEVLIKVEACALTKIDSHVIHGQFKAFTNLPFILGYEIAGTIVYYGKEVKGFTIGDHVVSIISLDMGGGCASYVVQKFYSVVHKPPSVPFEIACTLVGPGLTAMTALHYKFNLKGGDSILVLNGASLSGQIAIQLALSRSAKVITTISSNKQKEFIHTTLGIEKIIDLQKESLVSCVLEETGGVGVDFVFDATTTDSYENNFEIVPKNSIIQVLAPNGCWGTPHNIQIDPPQAQILALKGVSLVFLFRHSWTLFSTQQGRLLHILQDLMTKAENHTLEPKKVNYFEFFRFREALEILKHDDISAVALHPPKLKTL